MSANISQLNDRAASLGFRFGTFMLPKESVDPRTWAVIACDQHTSNPDYWRQVESMVGDAPSTLRLMLPEVYLGSGEERDRLKTIRRAMKEYRSRGLLRPTPVALIAVKRTTAHVDARRGLLVLLDLERYDFHPESHLPARATEETLEHRLPPRMEIRRNAVVEVSHVMVLLDDPEDSVIGPVFTAMAAQPADYKTSLMLGGGELSGHIVTDESVAAGVVDALESIASGGAKRYGAKNPPLFAIGDGNHTLASAKRVWEEQKGSLPPDHPLRYVMVELLNSHDPGLNVQPIHRIVWGLDYKRLQDELVSEMGAQDVTFTSIAADCSEATNELSLAASGDRQRISSGTMSPGDVGIAVQRRLEEVESRIAEVRVDYIHGADEAIRIADLSGGIAILYPPIDPRIVFETVAHHQVLPRKFFSLGEADEKRYYFECRSLV